MSVSKYQLANGEIRWRWRADLPPGPEGRRQKYGAGYLTEQDARDGEDEALRKHGRTEASAREPSAPHYAPGPTTPRSTSPRQPRGGTAPS
jgi:hypothetical protein